MYIIKFKMEELMPYESIVKKVITEKCKAIFKIAYKYGIDTYKTEYPFIIFNFENERDAINFYIDAKVLVDFIDIMKGEENLCQEKN